MRLVVSKRIKILFLETWSEIGGGQVGLKELLFSLDKNKFDPIVVIPDLNSSLFNLLNDVPGITIRELKFYKPSLIRPDRPFLPISIPRESMALSQLILSIKPDIIHANQIYAGKISCITAKKYGIPNIITIRNVYYNERFGLHRFVDRFIIKNSNQIVFNSNTGAKIFNDRQRSKKAISIQNGVFLEKFKVTASKEIFDLYKIPKNKRLVTVIAKLTPMKGHHVLIGIIPKLISSFPDIHFLFIGNEYENTTTKHDLMTLTSRLNVEKNITWIDFTDKIPELLSISHFNVLPSIMGEGLPRIIIESMAAGIPSIASDLAGVGELIENGKNGFLCAPNSEEKLFACLNKALSLSTNQYDTLVRQNLSIVKEKFDINKMINKYEDLYKSLVKC